MPTSLGNTSIVKAYLGNTTISKLYFGDVPLWSSAVAYPSFSIVGTGFNGNVLDLIIDPDNSLLLYGQFSSYNGTASAAIAKLLPNGDMDPNFKVGTGLNNTYGSNGRFLGKDTSGNYSFFFGSSPFVMYSSSFNRGFNRNVAIITPSGAAYNPGFNRFTLQNTSGSYYQHTVIGDHYWVYGSYNSISGSKDYPNVTVFNKNLTIVPMTAWSGSFTSSVDRVFQDRQGRVLIASNNRILRLTSPSGTLETAATWNTGFSGSRLDWMDQQSDNRYIFAIGNTEYSSSRNISRLIRVNQDGTRDTSFAPGVTSTNTIGVTTGLKVLPDDSILVVGSFTNYSGSTVNRIMKLTPNGQVDNTFRTNVGSGLNNIPYTVKVSEQTGDIFVGGIFTTASGQPRRSIAVYDQRGNLK